MRRESRVRSLKDKNLTGYIVDITREGMLVVEFDGGYQEIVHPQEVDEDESISENECLI